MKIKLKYVKGIDYIWKRQVHNLQAPTEGKKTAFQTWDSTSFFGTSANVCTW